MDYRLHYFIDDTRSEIKTEDICDVDHYNYNSEGCREGNKNIVFYNDYDEIILEIFNIIVIKIEAV